jgi:hypothetical protein
VKIFFIYLRFLLLYFDSLYLTGADAMLKFLQLVNEGHNPEIQSLMQNQQVFGSKDNFPLLSSVMSLLEAYVPNCSAVGLLTDRDGHFILSIFDFLTETVQGPCPQNQEFVATSAAPSVINLILDFVPNDTYIILKQTWVSPFGLESETLKSLRVAGLRVLMSLIEGRHPDDNDPVFKALIKFDLQSVPEKLTTIYRERNTEQNKMIVECASLRNRMNMENHILEEGFLLLAFARNLMYFQKTFNLAPQVPDTFVRNKFMSISETSRAKKEFKQMQEKASVFSKFDRVFLQ